MLCPRTQHSASGEPRTGNLSILSQALYYLVLLINGYKIYLILRLMNRNKAYLILGPVAQSVADPLVTSSILAGSHTFKIISAVILLLADSEGLLSVTSESMFTKY